jgi:hypothetical protein
MGVEVSKLEVSSEEVNDEVEIVISDSSSNKSLSPGGIGAKAMARSSRTP